MNVAAIITQHAERNPGAPAIIESGRRIDYAGFDRAIWRAVASFRRAGIAPGDRVGVSLRTHALHLVVGYALARLGAVQLTLSLRESTEFRQRLAKRFGVKAVIGESDLDPAWLEPGGTQERDASAPDGDAGWKIALTSGTTGEPKAALQTHAMHIAWRDIFHRAIGVLPSDRYLVTIELDFFGGFRRCMDVFRAGGAVLFSAAPRSADAFLVEAERLEVTYLSLMPTHLRQLLPRLPDERPQLPRLRILRTGAMTVTESLRDEIMRRLCSNLLVTYGTNDVGTPIAFADAQTLRRFPGCVGIAPSGVELGIADDEGRSLPAGEVGLIRVRAPGMPSGYIDNPEATARAFRGGWFYPGDLGLLTPEGALHFKGRADDMMNFDGIKIYPSEIEAVLLEHPAVAEAAAFPVSSSVHQDIPAAAVVLRHPVPESEIRIWCHDRMQSRAPLIVEILAELPRNSIGKVLKRELAKRLEGRLPEDHR